MNASLDERDREILEHLHRSAGGDVQALCELLGVTRNAVRQRIARLEALGLISSELRQQLRGRPRHLFRVTADGFHALGENYRELAVVLWAVITEVADVVVREQLVSRVRDLLAGRFRSQLVETDSVEDRLDQLAATMKASGFNVETDHSGGLQILRETSCPFPMLAEGDETICQVERQVLEQVLGVPVEFRSRCRDGHGCCEFQVLECAPVG